jgi:hypothetical protein
MFLVRGVVVLVILFGVIFATRLYRGWRAGLVAARPSHPVMPASLLDGAERTWVVFTTPYCATCGPVADRLQTSDPEARVIKVDATREPHLADAFSIRSAPTALLADGAGNVTARLVGADAVQEYLAPTR